MNMKTNGCCLNGNVSNAAKTVTAVGNRPSNLNAGCLTEKEENFEDNDLKSNRNTRHSSDAVVNSVFKTNGAFDSLNGACSKAKCKFEQKSNDRLPLLQKITDIPKYLRFNPYVLTGYRKPGLTYGQCIHSLFYYHNETVNILTHGIPFICFLLLTPPNIPWNEINYPILACFHIMGCVAPWLGSTIYHLFMNHERGEKFYRELLKWDVIGIWITQSFGASTTVYTSVALYPDSFRYTFILLYIVLSIRALKDSAMTDCVWRRRLGFTFLVIMRVIAFYCRCSTFEYGEGSKLIHLVMQEVLPIVGAFISASRIPERWFPGSFDFVFNSHNIMHVFVVLGAVHMHMATCSDLVWLSEDRNNAELLANNT